jgi:hypothetical protein
VPKNASADSIEYRSDLLLSEFDCVFNHSLMIRRKVAFALNAPTGLQFPSAVHTPFSESAGIGRI